MHSEAQGVRGGLRQKYNLVIGIGAELGADRGRAGWIDAQMPQGKQTPHRQYTTHNGLTNDEKDP